MKKIFNQLFKINLFISSYIPLYILIFIQEMDQLELKSALEVYRSNKGFWIILIIASILSLIALIIFFNGNHTSRENFGEMESIDSNVLDYFITYIIPLNTVSVTDHVSILVNLIIFFIIGIYYVKSDLMHLNILLIFLGYRVFEDRYQNIIISRKNSDYLRKNKNILCKKVGNTKIYIVK